MTASSPQVLVTGAAGFVGSHLVDQLLTEGYQVLGVDNLLTGRLDNLDSALRDDRFGWLEADASRPPQEYLPTGFKPELVFHLASPASPPQYQRFPRETYQVNAFGTHYLLEYLREQAPEARFLFASTSEVYGEPQVHPQVESYWGNVNPNGPRACYDESKRLGETIAGVYARDFNLDVRIARIFNTYGPRLSAADGRIIPNLLRQARAGLPYTIHGDGEQTRSFCFVSDLVRGLICLATLEVAHGETVNLGNPEEHSILSVARLVHRLVRGESESPKFNFLSRPTDDPSRRRPDISKAQELLNWSPEVKLETGLKLALESDIQ